MFARHKRAKYCALLSSRFNDLILIREKLAVEVDISHFNTTSPARQPFSQFDYIVALDVGEKKAFFTRLVYTLGG